MMKFQARGGACDQTFSPEKWERWARQQGPECGDLETGEVVVTVENLLNEPSQT